MDLTSASVTAIVAIVAVTIAVGIMRASARRQIAEVSTGLKENLAAAQMQARELQRQLETSVEDLSVRSEALAAMRAENAALKQDNKWLAGEIEREKKALDTAQSLLERAKLDVRDSVAVFAADALRANNAAFLELAKTSFAGLQQHAAEDMDSRHKSIDGLVQPILTALQQVDAKLGEAERERLEAYARLNEQVAALGSTANTLARALRTPAVRGRLGAMQLCRGVELSCMLQR